ncbi:hypothetical protein [Desulfofundulus thermocisternus]|uniref:hypothetical protein n=1 Tax=Desulfofundulus thermocisternus TaxID=42471 RepID=UPI0019E1FC26|nr:hypothetical protein [Desulfofundulus thermocisternus]MBE3586931.1 hypothetical protein [Thermoanaerobacter sp.]MCS5695636.1 hypothetical protein [Desulfofundulus thermocisternus]
MERVLDRVMDALDLETFLVCDSEEEGRRLILQLLQDMGFKDADVVFIQFQGPGVRVRARAYVHRSGDVYGWLKPELS